MPDVIVVGGGVIGAACAWELATAGASVTLLERDELAAGASGRNQGWLVQPEDPVNAPLHAPSLELYLRAAERAPIHVWIDPEPIGHLAVALEGDEVEAHAGTLLGAEEIRGLEPALAPSVTHGWLTDGGRRLDPAALTIGMALLAVEAGASIRHHLPARALRTTGDRVTGVVTDDGPIDAVTVVVAAGPWSGSLLDPIGASLPLSAARGWIVRLAPARPSVRHLVERAGWRASEWRAGAAAMPTARAFADEGIQAVGGGLLNPHVDGTVLVGSSREPAVGPLPADADVIRRQVDEAIALVPSLADAEVRSAWWGVRPMSPDERPVIGAMRDGLVVATGHGSEGVILGGGTARLVGAIVGGGEPAIDPTPFDPYRF